MNFIEKIDEWIKEAEERPASALSILKLVANRLRELSQRNEELLAENITLHDGSRVAEYEKRIAHLEYQLDLLKRRLGADSAALEVLPDISAAQAVAPNLLVYNAHGRMLRFEINAQGAALGHVTGELSVEGEWPRLLAVDPQEELLLLFTSGRVATASAAGIPVAPTGGTTDWSRAALPAEPHAGELLAGVMPLSHLPLADFILQTSRRGSVKKTLTSLAQSVFDNRYLGKGTLQKADPPFEVTLCQKGDHLALVTYEGRLLGLDVTALSYTAEVRMRLSATDFMVAAFILRPGDSLLCLTQTGKVILRDSGTLEMAKSGLARGQALISEARLAQGTRFVGAAPLGKGDDHLLAVLDAEGTLTLHLAESATGAGAIHTGGVIRSMGVIHPAGGKRPGS